MIGLAKAMIGWGCLVFALSRAGATSARVAHPLIARSQ
jgi:hypothetical protein